MYANKAPFKFDACYEVLRKTLPGYDYELTNEQNIGDPSQNGHVPGELVDGVEILPNGQRYWKYKEMARPIGMKKAKQEENARKDREAGIVRNGSSFSRGASSSRPIKVEEEEESIEIDEEQKSILGYYMKMLARKEEKKNNFQQAAFVNLEENNPMDFYQSEEEEETIIIDMDVANMDPTQQDYYQERKRRILKKRGKRVGVQTIYDSDNDEVINLD